ncbi:hypothetical protein Ae201684_019034 [Aphanomyces euteiches]|uniref:Uncharacterized protein n=1 Tax=Aphanomyces euteiches TaxID=100861 RepID=A0A6G0W3U2_9STRA|nr:hypothetical protein Ae201684_019034 [Aphanomyces euteiches]
MLHRLCGVLNALATSKIYLNFSKYEHSSFTAWTTGVSNPVRYPSFRFSVSVYTQIIAFAIEIPLIITRFYPYNKNSIILYLYSTLIFFFQLKKQPTNPLRLIISNNARPSRITAAAGTKLAGTSFLSTPSSLTWYCWIRLSPIVQYSSLLPLKKFGPCLSPNVADHSFKSAKDRWLGKSIKLPTT